MRLLYLNHNLYERGTFFRAFLLARHAVRQGHEVELWTAADGVCPLGRRFVRDGVRIWQPPRWIPPKRHDGGYAPLDNLVRLAAARGTRPGEFDVIHAFDHRPNVSLPWFLFRQARGAERRPLLAADWCDWWTGGGITTGRRRWPIVDHWEAKLEEGSKRAADLVTVISTPLQTRAHTVGVPEDRTHLLPSGADVDGIAVEDRAACRTEIGWPVDRPLLCFAGLSLWDLDQIVEAVLLVREKHPGTGLSIVGGGVEAEAIRVAASRLGEDGLLLPGQVPFNGLSTFLGAADIHLLPMQENLANKARLPNKLGDYLASGRPVVTADVGDTGALVRNEKAGIACGCDGAEMAAAVCRLLESETTRSEMGRRARGLAERRSWGKITDRLLDIYRQHQN